MAATTWGPSSPNNEEMSLFYFCSLASQGYSYRCSRFDTTIHGLYAQAPYCPIVRFTGLVWDPGFIQVIFMTITIYYAFSPRHYRDKIRT